MSGYAIPAYNPSRTASEAYLMLLGGVLFGYAMIGKGFAYIGMPPLFIGEVALLLGIVVLLRTGCLFASMATLPAVLLTVTMTWVLIRTVPYISQYGFNAARDSVIVMYGIFAFIVIAMLLEDPGRIRTITQRYLIFTGIYVFCMPLVASYSHFLRDFIPSMPGYVGVPMLQVRAGEIAAHLCGATVFAMVGFRKATLLWTLALVATLVIVSALSRSAMLSAIVPICFAALMLGHWRKLIIIVIGAGFLFSLSYAIEKIVAEPSDPPHITTPREAIGSEDRLVMPSQIADNVLSLFGEGSEGTESTSEWRLQWWDVTLEDTVFGEHFWAGRGFGVNLAEAHGLQQNPLELRPNRSPHNASITMLGRAGVTGLVLWIMLSISWSWSVLQAMFDARRRGSTDWANLFLFVFCYALAMHIDASLNVALENPMSGIWFWCLFGFGLGAVMIYRAQPREHDEANRPFEKDGLVQRLHP